LVTPPEKIEHKPKEEYNMKGTTKPKGIGIAATMLLAALLIAAVIVPVMACPCESRESIAVIELEYRGGMMG